MQKRVIVLSLGGSLIIPNEINTSFLKKFRQVLQKNSKNYKFVVVCGGGSTARKYIQGLKKAGKSEYFQGMMGIATTRMNARFMTYFFGKDANEGIPHDMKHVASLLNKNEIVFCGALRYAKDETSDGTSAKLAFYFNSPFINLTNVSGLHDKNPLEHKDAKFIPEISWKGFYKMANKKKFHPGQHFVLDQSASKIIMEKKINTYILGQDMKQLDNLLKDKKFKGTIISG
ncbi:UMP kinase [Candidatus Pacearchaeota archaeon]|nr:UMP kinase [Candidatus Pacearchaeota archaeon]